MIAKGSRLSALGGFACVACIMVSMIVVIRRHPVEAINHQTGGIVAIMQRIVVSRSRTDMAHSVYDS